MKIAIKSNKKLQFPPTSIGYVVMEIDLIQNKPKEGIYELRIVDRCVEDVLEKVHIINEQGESEEKDVLIEKTIASTTRFKTYTYDEIKELGNALNLNPNDYESLTDYINDLFRHGLLITTQQECQKGISGEGKGMYFSEAQDWVKLIKIIR